MSRTLLVGPAGSGKTHRLLDEFEQTIRNSDNPLDENYFFILPSAEHTERILSLILQRGVPGFFHDRVTTLPRLIAKVFGVPQENVASNVTRFLILRDILGKNTWSYFEDLRQSPGLIHLLLTFLEELKESLVSTAYFRQRMNELKKLEPDLAVKYETLAAMAEAYEAGLSSQGLRDRQDSIKIYQEMKKAGKFSSIRFSKIWLDGFFDFSAVQLEYIRELAAVSDEITISLTRDLDSSRPDFFERVNQTEETLLGLGFQKEPAKGRNQRTTNPVLLSLEKNLFSTGKGLKKIAAGEELIILEAVGMEGEIEMIAREIERIYRAGQYRFSDFAILLRQIGSYVDVIRSVFRRYKIPFEIHEREMLKLSPVIQTIAGLLRIFHDGWKRADLTGFLKSSYVRKMGQSPKDEAWVNEFEHRALRQGVLEGRQSWLEPWPVLTKEEDGERFNQEKRDILKSLSDLEDRLRGVQRASEMKKILLAALQETFGIFEICDSMQEFVRRDAASFGRLAAILDEIEASLALSGNSGIHFEQLAERFFHLVELDLYSLHSRDTNRVQVYDVSLARQKEYRVVFAAGLVEKSFPVQIKEDPVLSDWERRLFSGVAGGPKLRERLPSQNMERYFFYLALTRASERLFLTYPGLDLEGKESLPSCYLEEVKNLFYSPLKIKRQNLAHPYPELGDCLDWRELEASVMGELWNAQIPKEEEPFLLAVTRALLAEPEHRTKIERAFYEIRAELTDPLIRQSQSFQPVKTSPTRLEAYAKCHFRYFADRILQLKDPEENVNIFQKGKILHHVLQHFFSEWKSRAGQLQDPSKRMELIDARIKDAFGLYPLVFEKKYQYELDCVEIREFLLRFIETEVERLKGAALQPGYFELKFGPGPEDSYPALVIEDQNRNILVSGQIDRIDTDSEGRYGAVIDYKRSAQFKKDDLDLGVALQLPLYLSFIEKNMKLKPIAGELYSIRDRDRKGFYHEDAKGFLGEAGKRRAFMEDSQFRSVLNQSHHFVRRFVRDLANLDISVRPRYCDPYCPHASVCRIEKWRLDLILEEIRNEDQRQRETDPRAETGCRVQG